jgi:hypothetical protein
MTFLEVPNFQEGAHDNPWHKIKEFTLQYPDPPPRAHE